MIILITHGHRVLSFISRLGVEQRNISCLYSIIIPGNRGPRNPILIDRSRTSVSFYTRWNSTTSQVHVSPRIYLRFINAGFFCLFLAGGFERNHSPRSGFRVLTGSFFLNEYFWIKSPPSKFFFFPFLLDLLRDYSTRTPPLEKG